MERNLHPPLRHFSPFKWLTCPPAEPRPELRRGRGLRVWVLGFRGRGYEIQGCRTGASGRARLESEPEGGQEVKRWSGRQRRWSLSAGGGARRPRQAGQLADEPVCLHLRFWSQAARFVSDMSVIVDTCSGE